MEPLNLARININAPYKVWNEEETYRFETENGFMVRGTGFAWESSNTAVATVSANGLITAVGPGTAVITVYTTGYPVINQNHITIYVGNQTVGIGSGSVDQSDAE